MTITKSLQNAKEALKLMQEAQKKVAHTSFNFPNMAYVTRK